MGAHFQDHILCPVDHVSVSSVLFCKWLVYSTVCQWLDSWLVGGTACVVSSVDSVCIGFCEISRIIIAAGLINPCICNQCFCVKKDHCNYYFMLPSSTVGILGVNEKVYYIAF